MKKSKKRIAFLSSIIAMVSFLAFFAIALSGQNALKNLFREGKGTFTGQIYYLTEFRAYISELYTLGMLGYAGVGDENGAPLTDASANTVSGKARASYKQLVALAGEDLAYHIKENNQTILKDNFEYPLFSEQDSHLLLAENKRLCFYWNGDSQSLFFFDEEASSGEITPKQYYANPYQPNQEVAGTIHFVMAIPKTTHYTSDYFKNLQTMADSYRQTLLKLLITGSVFLLFAPLCLFTRAACKVAWLDCFTSLKRFFRSIKRLGQAILKAICGYYHKLFWQRKAILLYCFCGIAGILLLIIGTLAVIWYFFPAKQVLLWIAMGLLLFTAAFLLLFCLRLKCFIQDTIVLADQLADISHGTGRSPVRLSRHSLLTDAAADLNTVEQGIEAAVEQNIRANKMRVELITNVSHDLKTPLTSIINYADLLCEESLPSPADDYAKALRAKAYRLKGMVQDVFELSKATSGNLHIESTSLDFAKLIHQTLADMDERIRQSTLCFKLNITDEPLFIEADGEKLYRVFQNLIMNALQYSLEHSRVYIHLYQAEGKAIASIKNTSRQELNFSPDEIVERFVRADTSRTGEGSGLGLSIAQSFTEACGGSFSIELNADLFTACVSFPMHTE